METTEIPLFLIGIAVAIIIFILDKTMKTFPRYLVFTGYTAAAILLVFSCLLFYKTFNTLSIILTCLIIIVASVTLYFGRKPQSDTKQQNAQIEAKTKELRLKLVKLLHNGKDIQAKLKQAQNIDPRIDSSPQVSAEIHFESWLADVSNALQNTEFKKVWYEHKSVDYHYDSLTDYIDASGRALGRIEDIIKLIS